MNGFRTILLADDNANDVELTLLALGNKGLSNRVVVVNDGVEVLEYLRCEGKFADRKKELPAVILLDIKMPRMDGIEVLEHIRNAPAFKLIPVVMLSSSREEIDMKKAYSLGANGYVVKPVDIQNFIESIVHVGMYWGIINELPSLDSTPPY
ncbi:MAG: response regulator [Paludibacter sp.]